MRCDPRRAGIHLKKRVNQYLNMQASADHKPDRLRENLI